MCRGKANTHLGYFWKFKDDLNKEFLINEKNSKILEYDSKTGKLLNKYNSIGEASKLTGINYSQISMMCNDTSKESNNKYFRYENNDFPKQERIKTFKKVVLIENNIPTIFNSLKDCSEYLKCSAKCVIKNCKSMKKLSHEIYYKSDWDNGLRKIKIKDKKTKKLYIKDINTLEIKEYSSITEACNVLNIKSIVIRRCIKRNGIYKKQYQFSKDAVFPNIITTKKFDRDSQKEFVDNNTNYYLYVLLDPEKKGKFLYENLNVCFLYEPFYIGKGKNNRIKHHFYPSS